MDRVADWREGVSRHEIEVCMRGVGVPAWIGCMLMSVKKDWCP